MVCLRNICINNLHKGDNDDDDDDDADADDAADNNNNNNNNNNKDTVNCITMRPSIHFNLIILL